MSEPNCYANRRDKLGKVVLLVIFINTVRVLAKYCNIGYFVV